MAAQTLVLTSDLVSRRYPAAQIRITREWGNDFLRCLGYSDWVGEDLPLSFYSCLKENEFEVFADLEIKLQQLLHVSQHFEYFAPVKIGDEISAQASISRVVPRKLGGEEVVYLELKNEFSCDGQLRAISEGSVIVRRLAE